MHSYTTSTAILKTVKIRKYLFPHCLHENGLSPVCTLICLIKSLFFLKLFGQWGHTLECNGPFISSSLCLPLLETTVSTIYKKHIENYRYECFKDFMDCQLKSCWSFIFCYTIIFQYLLCLFLLLPKVKPFLIRSYVSSGWFEPKYDFVPPSTWKIQI